MSQKSKVKCWAHSGKMHMVQCRIVFQERHHFIGVYVNEIVVLVLVLVHDSEVVYKGVLLQ